MEMVLTRSQSLIPERTESQSHFSPYVAKNIRYSLRNRNIIDKDSEDDVRHTTPTPLLAHVTPLPDSSYSEPKTNSFLRNATESCSSWSACTINKLPNEVLTMIFSYLSVEDLAVSVAPVCKLWYGISKSPALWKRLDFTGDKISTKSAKDLLTKSPLLACIKMINRMDIEDLLPQLCSTNHGVQSVTIKYTGTEVGQYWDMRLLRAKLLNRVTRRCQRIETLKLKSVSIRSNKFFTDVGTFLPHLRNLNLSYNHYLTPVHIISVAKTCKNLARLWLSGELCCGPVKEWEKAYNALFSECWKTLTDLQIDSSKISDNTYKGLEKCVNLRTLHLHKAVNLKEEGLAAIGTLRSLVSLRLYKACSICPNTLPLLFQAGNMKSLISFCIPSCHNVTDDCAEVIARHCPNLHVLSLALVDGITDAGVSTIVQHCTILHYLDIFHMKNVTGSSFRSILTFAKNLSVLVLEETCDPLKEEFLRSFLKNDPGFKIIQTREWKTGGSYKCKIIS